MTNPYRDMCSDLIDALDSGIPAGRIRMSPLADLARALLAEPEPAGPTDEGLRELRRQHDWPVVESLLFPIARTVLAKWGANAQ